MAHATGSASLRLRFKSRLEAGAPGANAAFALVPESNSIRTASPAVSVLRASFIALPAWCVALPDCAIVTNL